MSIVLKRAMLHIETKIKNGETLSNVETDIHDLIHFESLSPDAKLNVRSRLSKLTLLSDGQVNPKTAKTVAGFEFKNFILHLTPSDLSGVNLCPKASQGCKAACLNAAGRGRFDLIQFARLRKTLYYINLRQDFWSHVDREIGRIESKASKNGVKVTIRLNGTSDLPIESIKVRDGLSLIQLYQNVTFYDYTKIFSRLARVKSMGLENYHLTFSASESNSSEVLKALDLGFNVATVFDSVPKTYLGRRVIDGDSHDFRFLDAKDSQGLIVGLKAKGPAKRDASGFVKRIETIENKKTA